MLSQMLNRLKPVERPCRIAVIGVGQELCGDDAVGVWIARQLQGCGLHSDGLLVTKGGVAPENVAGSLRRFQPDLVVLIDAGWLNLSPGQARLVVPDEASRSTATTHTVSLAVLAEYLRIEMGCEVVVLGVQVEQVQFGAPMSDAVRAGAEAIVGDLARLLSACQQPS